ncbi:Gfo/Idh/MocA family oxidoreductase [Bacillaceae bacterium S4-13-58]
MKIGMIGIGDIAKKAYLPILTQTMNIELHICTRNLETLQEIKEKHRIKNTYNHINDWLNCGMEAAFVHSSTESHERIVDQLLDHGIHVYVDKPITYNAASSERLMNKAKNKGLILKVGFNRRFAPPYQKVKEVQNPNMVLIQKNRANLATDPRTFIFDDFIHVIDTLLYLFPYHVENFHVHGKIHNGLLHHVSLQLEAREGTAIGVMNREAGTTQEKVEVISSEETRMVTNVNEVFSYKDKKVLTHESNDWEPTLQKRGFYGVIEEFLTRVRQNDPQLLDYNRDLKSHLIAEKIVQSFE